MCGPKTSLVSGQYIIFIPETIHLLNNIVLLSDVYRKISFNTFVDINSIADGFEIFNFLIYFLLVG